MRLLLIHARATAEAARAFQEALPSNEAFDISVANERGAPPFDYWAVVVLLWSKEFGTALPADVDRAVLDAWADNKLLLFRLDDSELPLGLRDLPAIRAVGPLQKGLLYEAGKALKQSIRTGLAEGFGTHVRGAIEGRNAAPRAAPSTAPQASFGLGGNWQLYGGAAAFIGVIGVGGLPLARGSSASGGGSLMTLLWAAIIALLAGGGWLFYSWRRQRGARSASPPAPQATANGQAEARSTPRPAKSDDLFVSYARADRPVVDQVLLVLEKEANKSFWIDQHIPTGDTWAGEIVRAIQTARGVLLMCSKRSFGSDYVKREIYLADRYKKPITPVYVEEASPPPDFEFFLAGIQYFEWYKIPPQERPAAITAALATI